MKEKCKKLFRTLFVALTFVFAVCGFEGIGGVTAQAATPALKKKTVTLNAGQEYTLQVTNASQKVTWSSSNKKVVSVKSTSGTKKTKAKIVAVKPGKATITAKVGSKKLKATVTVRSFTVNKKTASVKEGSAITLTAKNAGKNVTWKSSNPAVAKIVQISGSKKSKITVLGVSKGTATITGKIGSVKVTTKVTVKHVHSWAKATCTSPKTCKTCGATTGSVLPHNYSGPNATCQREKVCANGCGTVLQSKTGHSGAVGEVATCTHDVYCQYGCGTLISHIEHNYVNGICSYNCGTVRLTDFFSMNISQFGGPMSVVRVYIDNSLMRNNVNRLYVGIEEDIVNGNVCKLTTGGKVYEGLLVSSSTSTTPIRVDTYGSAGYGTTFFRLTESTTIGLDATIEFQIRFIGQKYKVVVSRTGYTWTKI